MNALRWLLLMIFWAGGIFYLLWAFQSASFSGAVTGAMAEIYKTQALVFLPLSICMFGVGFAIFAVLRKGRR